MIYVLALISLPKKDLNDSKPLHSRQVFVWFCVQNDDPFHIRTLTMLCSHLSPSYIFVFPSSKVCIFLINYKASSLIKKTHKDYSIIWIQVALIDSLTCSTGIFYGFELLATKRLNYRLLDHHNLCLSWICQGVWYMVCVDWRMCRTMPKELFFLFIDMVELLICCTLEPLSIKMNISKIGINTVKFWSSIKVLSG